MPVIFLDKIKNIFLNIPGLNFNIYLYDIIFISIKLANQGVSSYFRSDAKRAGRELGQCNEVIPTNGLSVPKVTPD